MNRDTATAKANYCGPGIYAQRPDHNTGNYVPFSLRAVSGWGKGGGGGGAGARGKYVVKSGRRRSATIFFLLKTSFAYFPLYEIVKSRFGFSEKEKKTITTNKQTNKERKTELQVTLWPGLENIFWEVVSMLVLDIRWNSIMNFLFISLCFIGHIHQREKIDQYEPHYIWQKKKKINKWLINQ